MFPTRAVVASLAVLGLALGGPLATQNGAVAQADSGAVADGLAAVGGVLTSIAFYPHGDEKPLPDERAWSVSFERARTQYVGTQLTFRLEPPTEPTPFDVHCAYTRADGDGSPFAGVDIAFIVQPGWTSITNGEASGYADPGR